MAHPQDNSAIDEIREYERGHESEKWRPQVEKLQADLAALQKKYDDYVAAHPEKPEEPDQPSSGGKRQDLVGVRVFPHYSTKNYGEHEKVLNLLEDLKIKRISGLLAPNTVKHVNGFYKEAYERCGIKVWFTVGAPRVVLTDKQWANIQSALEGARNRVEIVSGWNEPNHVRGGGTLPADWPQTTIAHQKRLYEIAQPLGISVGTPQLWSGNMDQHEADLKKIATGAKRYSSTTAWHLYPRGTVGKKFVDQFYTLYEAQLGKRPVVCTEAGYFTGSATGTGAKPVTEAQQAEYLPKHVALYTDKGDRISYFELLDDPAGGREGTLGIVRANWTKKPAFNALRDFITAA